MSPVDQSLFFDPDFSLRRFFQELLKTYRAKNTKRHFEIHAAAPSAIPTDRGWQHFHQTPEMFIQLGGKTCFRFPNMELNLNAGDICILPRQLAHQESMEDTDTTFANIVLVAHKDRLSYHLTIRDQNAGRGINMLHYDYLESKRSETVNRCMDEIVHAQHKLDHPDEFSSQSFSNALIGLLINMLEDEQETENAYNQKTRQCLDYIDFHIGNSALSVQLLAKWLGCHPDYLSKLFHQDLGVRLNNYISSKRIDIAKDTLHTTNLSITAIAHASGFQDPGYFARQFKKQVGCTPQAFRDTVMPK